MVQAVGGWGLPDGARHLAYMYEFGLGVGVDRVMALKYYDRAAAGGDAMARRAAANLRSPEYDRPANMGMFGGGMRSRCSTGFVEDITVGCKALYPGMTSYVP